MSCDQSACSGPNYLATEIKALADLIETVSVEPVTPTLNERSKTGTGVPKPANRSFFLACQVSTETAKNLTVTEMDGAQTSVFAHKRTPWTKPTPPTARLTTMRHTD